MHAADTIAGVLLGAGALAFSRAALLAVAGPHPSSGRPRRTELWAGAGLVAVGCGVYVRVVWVGRPPLHPAGITTGAPWWQVATLAVSVPAVVGTLLLAAVAGRVATRALRRRGRRPIADADMSALTARHDAIRERYGALLSTAGPHQLDQVGDQVEELTAALTEAADLRSGADTTFAQRSAYARAVGEAEAAWQPLAAAAGQHGVTLPAE
ncbi:hypothetical protein [Kitasatospora sp. NBC_01302]|uniref:hypothetical protein n=1 Tax=Kitasatospora sp. NBC_01302 TaxID=2903575 RepID=UPI002E14FF00|nr:hypothetical protein OG294_40845 [Kitasatospora sp. NBC_01302]